MRSVAEEMGAALRRSSYSPNIKERRDYSCAIFDAEGNAIAMGDHMPVHLGSMPMSVKTATDRISFRPGDVVILNDPYAGGTHLPDITMVQGVFADEDTKRPLFFVGARAHHADVGGRYPGSMGPCSEIYQEGLRIPPIKIAQDHRIVPDVMDLLLCNVRTPEEREGDLTAQMGACRIGEERLLAITRKFGVSRVRRLGDDVLAISERSMRTLLHDMPEGCFEAEDFLDDDGFSEEPIPIRVALRLYPKESRAEVDFSQSANQVKGNVNAVYAITYSAVLYVFRCMSPKEVSANAGMMRPISVKVRHGSVVAALAPAAVAAGNVETSQRIVDVLMKAIAKARQGGSPAASSGTMNNLTIGGIDSRTGESFAYYETVAGGMGACRNRPGLSGVHTHMTNSLNTPAEALEYAYPLRVRRYAYRRNSGGQGIANGGDGLIREIELLDDAQVTLLADRRKFAPFGLEGGEPGRRGITTWISKDGAKQLPGKCSVGMSRGDLIRIESPGGGGHGRAEELASHDKDPQ